MVAHFKCVKHRQCSGPNEWIPDECDVCMLFKLNSKNASEEAKNSSFRELFQMLEETSEQLSTEDQTWEFEHIFRIFLDIQDDHDAPNDELEEGQIVDESESQQAESSQKTRGVTNEEEQAAIAPTTNELLIQTVSELQAMTGMLGPVLSQFKKQKAKNDRRNIKRQRSPSPAYSDDDPSEEDENLSEIDQSYPSNGAQSPQASSSRAKRRKGQDWFNEGSTIYFYTSDHKRVGNKVWFHGELKNVKWHPTVDAFSLVTTPTNESPFMSSTQAHESLVSYFNTTQDNHEKPGLNRKCYRVNFDDSKGLAHALRLIQHESPEALHLLYMGDHKKFLNSFSNPAFKPATMVNFASGWTFTGEKYLDWAKDDKLRTLPFSLEIQLNYTPFIPAKFLDEECSSRALVVNSLSGLSMLESLANKVKGNSNRTAVEAISRHYLSQLGDNILKWYIAKMNVRKIALQNSQAPEAVELLESNMWDPRLFSQDTLKRLKENDNQRWGLAKRLGLKKEVNRFYLSNPTKVTPDKSGNNTKKNELFLNRLGPAIQHNKPQFEIQTTNKIQPQSNQSKWGSKFQNSGVTRQIQRTKVSGTNKKPWLKHKRNTKGGAGFAESTNGNQSTQ